MSIVDRVRDLVEPLLAPLELSIYDLEVNGGNLRITVDAPGGVNLDVLAEATRAISRMLDDEDPMPGKYTLEVSSPGLERRLRTPEHFIDAVGETVAVKLAPHVDGDRRRRGELRAADASTITLVDDDDATIELALDDITKATTVFEWGPAPKPGSPEARKAKAKNKAGAPDNHGAPDKQDRPDRPDRKAPAQ